MLNELFNQALHRDVEASLSNATALFDSWKRIYNTVSSPSSEELAWTADDLTAALEAISQDLEDLEESVSAVQANPEKFKVTSSEIQARNNFISRTRSAVREMADVLKNPPRKEKSKGKKVRKTNRAICNLETHKKIAGSSDSLTTDSVWQ